MKNKLTQSDQFKIPYNYISPHRDGVYLAVNALPDSYLVYDIHSCGYYKAEKIAGNHDLFSDLLRWDQMNRIVRTNLDSQQYIMGSEDKLSMKILQVHERYRPEIIFVARSPVVIAAGHDADAVLQDLRKKIKTPLVKIPDRSVAEDYVTGYLDTLTAMFDLYRFKNTESTEPTVAIAGYLFERNEGDHQGNIAELKRMLSGMGIQPGPVLLDGTPFSTLCNQPKPTAVIDLADEWNGAQRLASKFSVPYLRTSLPIGIRGTEQWIRSVSTTLGVEDKAELFIKKELSELIPLLKWILPSRLIGKSVMVFANRLTIVPLVSFLEEIGMRVTAVGCTSEDFTHGTPSQNPIEGRYPAPPFSTQDLTDFAVEAKAKGNADLIIGNSFIHQLVHPSRAAFVEFGYPTVFSHALHSSPYLGFNGVKILIQQIINSFLRQELQSDIPTHNTKTRN